MGHPTIYPTGVTLYKPEKCWSGFTIFQANEMGAVLMDMNGREINVWKGVHGMPNKIFPGGYLLTGRGRRSGSWKSNWIVPHCQVLPIESCRWKSILGP